jgi:hypothetical protein
MSAQRLLIRVSVAAALLTAPLVAGCPGASEGGHAVEQSGKAASRAKTLGTGAGVGATGTGAGYYGTQR